MKRHFGFTRHFNGHRGSLTVEAAVVVPLCLLLLYLLVTLVLSEAAFNALEEELHLMLIESVHTTLCAEDLAVQVGKMPRLRVEEIVWNHGALEFTAEFDGRFRRHWRVDYPLSRIPFERLVYVTDTGMKYHHFGCIHLRESLVPLVYSKAIRKHTACRTCY